MRRLDNAKIYVRTLMCAIACANAKINMFQYAQLEDSVKTVTYSVTALMETDVTSQGGHVRVQDVRKAGQGRLATRVRLGGQARTATRV